MIETIGMARTWQSRAREAMRAQNIKQSDIVGRLGKTKGAVSSWFSGRHQPSLADLKELAEMLGMSLAEMLSEDDSLARNKLELEILRTLRSVPEARQADAAALIAAVLATLRKPPSPSQ